MKRFIFIFTILLIIPFYSALSQNMIDVIHLKNGDILKGLIIENVPNDYVKIELSAGSVFTVKYTDIAKFTKEKAPQNEKPKIKQPTQSYGSYNIENSRNTGGGSLLLTLLGGIAIYDGSYPGTGFRIGGTILNTVYMGATAATHFGDVSVSYYGAELGVNLSQSAFTLQFYASLGGVTSGGYTEFYFGPAVAIYFPINRNLRIGGDFKYISVPEIEDDAAGLYLGLQFTW